VVTKVGNQKDLRSRGLRKQGTLVLAVVAYIIVVLHQLTVCVPHFAVIYFSRICEEPYVARPSMERSPRK
jgi:hypothetical protein